MSSAGWPPLAIMMASALEFSWLDHALSNELIAALLTLMTPLPFASLVSHRRSRRARVHMTEL